MTRITLTILNCLIFTCLLSAQVYYLKYDETCMDRLEYASETDAAAYVSYNFDLNSGEQIVFDIGTEEAQWVRDLPGKVIQCSDMNFGLDLVSKINSGEVKIFIVRESPTHYNVSAVDKAVYLNRYATGVTMIMEDASVVLDFGNLVSGRNLALQGSQMQVFLEGTIQYQCVKGYILKKMQEINSTSFKEYIMVPELGIVEKRAVSKLPTQSAAKIMTLLKLNKVGEASLPQKLTAICDAIQASYYDTNPGAGAAVGGSAGNTTPKNVADTAIPASYDNSPCAVAPRAGVHLVQKGETLYSISKRYGITLNQLRAWNSLAGDVINICQALNVMTPTNIGTMPSGEITAKGEGYWVRNANVHIVRPGENLAALAKMYGYTEERFRKMNNLGPFERVFAGQSLHTSDCVCPSTESTTAGTPMPYENTVTESLTANGNPDVYFKPIQVHLVQKSESLFSIAKQYGTTADRISELNGLGKDAKLVNGQRIYVQ